MDTYFASRRPLVTALIIALTLAISSTLVASANVPLVQISSDPYTNLDSQHRTEVEPDTFAVGATIVSAFQVGRFFDGGASNIGFATSTDSGAAWTSGLIPGSTVNATPAGIYARASDPTVAYDAKHGAWLISYLGLWPNGNGSEVDVLVSRSTDGGFTWSLPAVVNASGHFNDKNWTVCDNTATSPYYGNCYTEFDDATLGDRIRMSTSTDGGSTWGAALPTGNNSFGIGGQPQVQPNGNVVVPIVGFAGRGTYLLLSFTSGNGGASWTSTRTITRVAFHNPAGSIRADIPLPSAETDASGRVYLVWADCRFESNCSAGDLVMSTSNDGKVWSPVTRLPLDAKGSGVDHFIPGLAVDRTTSGSSAHLAVTYYYYPNANCTTATCQLDVGYSTSADGGASWTSTTQIAGPMSLTWLPNTNQGYMVGDYISTSFSGAQAYPAISVANLPSGSVFDQATYTVAGGLSMAANANPVRDQAKVGSSLTPTSSSITDQ